MEITEEERGILNGRREKAHWKKTGSTGYVPSQLSISGSIRCNLNRSFLNLCVTFRLAFSLRPFNIPPLLHCDLHCYVQHSKFCLCTLSQSLSSSIGLMIESCAFHCILVVFSLVSLSMSCVPVIPLSIRVAVSVCREYMYLIITLCPCDPIHFCAQQSIVHIGLVCIHLLYTNPLLYVFSKMLGVDI